MTAIIGIVVQIVKDIPIVDGWIQQFIVAYTQAKISSWKQENVDAIRKALQDHDQRPLEQAIGSNTAGKPSGDAGADIVDSLPPGVPKP